MGSERVPPPTACTAAASFLSLVCMALGLGCACQSHLPAGRQVPPPAVASSAVPAPSPAPAPAPSPAPARLHLRVGTSGDYAPFSLRDASGTVRGFDVEIAEALAGDLGL